MKSSAILTDWKQRPIVLATMHHKERVIAPLFERELGVTVKVPDAFDTDRFGTFTRDVTRAGNQLEAARAKALAALEYTGLDLTIASEGSFASHPSIPFLPSNLEIVVLIDKKNGLEIVGHHRSHTVHIQSQSVQTSTEAMEVAQSWGFPEQGVIVRLTETSKAQIYKDIQSLDELEKIAKQLLQKWLVKSIFLETDMRAHRCPRRMEAIKYATQDLIKHCQSLCPECTTPGFVITDVTRGLTCRDCGTATDLVKETISACQKCQYQLVRPVEMAFAEPADCGHCNP